MTHPVAPASIAQSVRHFLAQRKILMLSTLDSSGEPYVSCAPFALSGEAFYVPLDGCAARACSLQTAPPPAMVLMVEEERVDSGILAQTRVIYQVTAQPIDFEDARWDEGISVLAQRHGNRVLSLSQFHDFRLFRLTAIRGRFITRTGRAYTLSSTTLIEPATGKGHSPPLSARITAPDLRPTTGTGID